MSGSVDIGFNGNCEEAFEFYSANLGGMVGRIFREGASENGRVVHGDIVIHGLTITGGDVSKGDYKLPQGVNLLLAGLDDHTVRTYFEVLSKDGVSVMHPQKTFFSTCYAMVIDKFGVPWKLNSGS
ncbi:VOC family protein [Arenicella chitinivorans]|uniref:VOC family protein n=1 Tax=Arenicella chitinivorans TaxID=1329800 RepID=A0A918S0Z3_9GAMM|nr:VOC family protein [Arenicella chitinivorans]GHA16321.1 VOC family protein [Arenicella chitinivorans]